MRAFLFPALVALALPLTGCSSSTVVEFGGGGAGAGNGNGSGNGNGNGGHDSCQADGACDTGSDCCSGQCEAGQCAASCLGMGALCDYPTSCCSGECNAGQCTAAIIPTCDPDGASCSSPSDCCSGACSGGFCGAATGNCAHDVCTEGEALASGCNPCVTSICGDEPYCCQGQWVAACVTLVSSLCGQGC